MSIDKKIMVSHYFIFCKNQMTFMSHKFLSIVRAFEMEIPPANVLLFIETRNDFVSQIPTFYFYV